jgi:2-polyprenyl-3-methyl-5-hydroxy-6-metoxy-1,4-benzoquinol methylase
MNHPEVALNQSLHRYEEKPDPWSSHSVIAGILSEYPPGTRILDVGSASGMMGRICNRRGLLFTGIEPVPEWAEESRPFYEGIIQQDLQHTDDTFLSGFRVVLCADVLEHMSVPEFQLSRLVRLQSSGTMFIVSVPNIANLWVRINLLVGKFDYMDRGILDRTHLRFFTYKSAKEMILSTGLLVNRVFPTPVPLNLISPFWRDRVLGRTLHGTLTALTKIFPRLLGYQFVITAIKP